MSLLGYPTLELSNESDVEQKFLLPLLSHGSFLSIPQRHILTKKSMSSLAFVKKEQLPVNYIPDYVIVFKGFPACIIEAKGPEASLENALREARAYGTAINQRYPSAVNPVCLVVACNGVGLSVGGMDNLEVENFACEGLMVGSAALVRLKALLNLEIIEKNLKGIISKISATNSDRASRALPSQIFSTRVSPNSLAQHIRPISEMYFKAEDAEKIDIILEKAYVNTAEVREYDGVLQVMLKTLEKTFENIINTDRNREYTITPEIARYHQGDARVGRLHLIIGARGSGKSLFIARFFKFLFPDSLKRDAAWCTIDFNKAPSDLGNIEDFLCSEFLANIQNLGFELDEREGLEKIFSVEINKFKRGPATYLAEKDRESALGNEVMIWVRDVRLKALGLSRYLVGNANRPVIVALDNVDRRDSQQQLAIFQAAQWFRNNARAFTLLTLRDVTFDRFKREPPLDTYADMSNFYIRPPRFSSVIQKRLDLALNDSLGGVEQVSHTTSSGMRINYNKSHLRVFLDEVYKSLFVDDRQIAKILDALAEKDVRHALGMFARIISSGHFDPDHIIGLGTGGGKKIPSDVIIKILMREDFKVYSRNSGVIHNIFAPDDVKSAFTPFLVPEILGYLSSPQGSGKDAVPQYWRVEEIISEMSYIGFSEDSSASAISWLVKKNLLAFDGEGVEFSKDDDLLKITPSGVIHLRILPGFIEFIASVALHAPISDPAILRKIEEIWSTVSGYNDLSFRRKVEVAELFYNHLSRELAKLNLINPIFKERNRECENLLAMMLGELNEGKRKVDRSVVNNSKVNPRRPRRQ